MLPTIILFLAILFTAGYINKIIGRSPMVVIGYVYISRDALKEDISAEDSLIGSTIEEQG